MDFLTLFSGNLAASALVKADIKLDKQMLSVSELLLNGEGLEQVENIFQFVPQADFFDHMIKQKKDTPQDVSTLIPESLAGVLSKEDLMVFPSDMDQINSLPSAEKVMDLDVHKATPEEIVSSSGKNGMPITKAEPANFQESRFTSSKEFTVKPEAVKTTPLAVASVPTDTWDNNPQSNFEIPKEFKPFSGVIESVNFKNNADSVTLQKPATLQGVSSLNAFSVAVGQIADIPSFDLVSQESFISEKISSSASLKLQASPALALTHLTPAAAASQIVAAIRADKGGDTIEIRLDPPELGQVKISFSMETAEAVKGVLTAELSHTLDHLRKHAEALTKELEAAGFASIDLEFSDKGAEEFSKSDADSVSLNDNDTAISSIEPTLIYATMNTSAQLNMLA